VHNIFKNISRTRGRSASLSSDRRRRPSSSPKHNSKVKIDNIVNILDEFNRLCLFFYIFTFFGTSKLKGLRVEQLFFRGKQNNRTYFSTRVYVRPTICTLYKIGLSMYNFFLAKTPIVTAPLTMYPKRNALQ